ncbi:MAG TPA: PASTA domain-containing protein, partial [Ilumatobacteraceae bacterium]|nr:PASTA domain-containing protein [Ilumatobacteraceae bacterium]
STLTSDAYKFVVTVEEEPSENIPEGSATRTDPVAGTPVEIGSEITLYISSGPEQVTVPPLENLTEAQARNQLTSVGLVPDVQYQTLTTGDPKIGRVISQNVPAGTKVDPGTTVRILVGRAPAPPPTTTSTTTTTSPPPTDPPTT